MASLPIPLLALTMVLPIILINIVVQLTPPADLVRQYLTQLRQELGNRLADRVYESGKLKALAVSSSERVAELPDVPTFAQAGMKDFDANSWLAVVVRAEQAEVREIRSPAVLPGPWPWVDGDGPWSHPVSPPPRNEHRPCDTQFYYQ